MKDTVLIIGSHPDTRALVDWAREDCEYWTFNEAYSQQFAPDAKEKNCWCKRSDTVFQMHDPIIWRNPQNRNDKTHAEWLQSGNTPTIIMQEAYQEVPKAVKFPLDEVLRKFGGISRKFFTSSVSLAIAYAAYLGFKRVEVYGVEMEFGSEYFEQRDAVTFWMGACAGIGAELVVHAKFLNFRPVYGYEGRVTVESREFAERIDELTPLCEDAKKYFDGLSKPLHKALTEAILAGKDEGSRVMRIMQEMIAAASRFGQLDGARQVCERYLAKSKKSLDDIGSEYIFVKTEFEQQVAAHSTSRTNAMAELTANSTKLQDNYAAIWTTGNVKKRQQRANHMMSALDEFIKLSHNVGFFTGGAEENKRYVNRLNALIRAAGGQTSELVMMEAMQEVSV